MTKERDAKTYGPTWNQQFRQPRYDLVFSHSGVVQSATSPPWRPRDHSTVYGARIEAGTPPNGNCVFTLKINGQQFAQLSLGAGQTHARTGCFQAFTVNDRGTVTSQVDGALADITLTWEYGIP